MIELISDDFIREIAGKAETAFWDVVASELPIDDDSATSTIAESMDFSEACVRIVQITAENTLKDFEVTVSRMVRATIIVKALSEAHIREALYSQSEIEELLNDNADYEEDNWDVDYVCEA